MTAQALIKQSDLKRMAAIAKQEGVCVEVTREGTIRVFPDNQKKRQDDESGIDEWDSIRL